MNKTDLIICLSEQTAFSKKDVTFLVDSLTRIIEQKLKTGEKVSIAGFGTFMSVKRESRVGVNPRTTKKITIPSMRLARFRPGKSLKDSVKAV